MALAAGTGALPPPLALGSVAARYRHPLSQLGAARPARQTDAAEPAPPLANSPYRRNPRLKRLEAVLFLSREPISARKLSQFADLADAGEARTLVRRLNAFYDQSGRAFRVEEAAGGFLLQTRARFANWIRRCPQTPRELRLSAPALETLTVIAYRQPVARSEIEAIRGVNCGEILRQLLDRDMVKIGGRSDELGRPYLYETTPRFLQAFGLKRIEDLPALRPTNVVSRGDAPEAEPIHEEVQTREGDAEVSVTTTLKSSAEELEAARGVAFANPFSPRLAAKRAEEDEEEDEDEEWDDEDDDEEDDFDDEDEDLDDEEEDEDDLEEEEWEEVDDEDEDLDDEEEDEEWDEEEDEEWDEDEEDDEDWDEDEDEEEDEEEGE